MTPADAQMVVLTACQATCPREKTSDVIGVGLVCHDCYNASVRARRAARKAQLAAEPRCEVPGCKARGAWIAGSERTLLCGRHLKRARVSVSRYGILGLTATGERKHLLAWATQ